MSEKDIMKKIEGISCGKQVDLMLAKKHDPATLDPKGWLISEKLDGVRCYWNGEQMLTRNGNLFYPPDWFIKELPKDLALDGELFTERDDFQKVVSIVRRQDKNDTNWKKVKYMVFDAPLIKKSFKKRYEILQKELKNSAEFIQILE